MLRSQMPVRLLGAWMSASPSGGGVFVVGVAVVVPVGGVYCVLEADDDVEVVGAPAVVVDTAVASKARQPYREDIAVARSPPAWCQPTMASTRFCATASTYSAT